MNFSFLKLGALALVAVGFVACSDESRLGIQKPLIVTKFDNGNFYYVIQSQDENTIIEDYVVNRGNCGKGLPKYEYDLDLEKKVYKEFCPKYKDKDICGFYRHYIIGYLNIGWWENREGIAILLDKQGKKVKKKYKLFSNSEDMDYLKNLHDDFKQFYKKAAIKLGYGRTMQLDIGKCSADEVIEAQLVLNGGKKITYNVSVATGGY